MDGARAAAEAAVLEDERRLCVWRRALRDHERRRAVGRCVVVVVVVVCLS